MLIAQQFFLKKEHFFEFRIFQDPFLLTSSESLFLERFQLMNFLCVINFALIEIAKKH